MNDYLETYQEHGIYDHIAYGCPAISKGFHFARYLIDRIFPTTKVFCIGIGNGFELVTFLQAGIDAIGSELHDVPAIPTLKGRILKSLVPDLPFKDKEFDLVFCCEVMEHIPEELTDDFIKECQRVSKFQFFSIATSYDPPFNTHINIHEPQWWLDKFKSHDATILNFQYGPQFSLSLPSGSHIMISYPDGVMVQCG